MKSCSPALAACVTLLSSSHVIAACESAAGNWSAVWPLSTGGQFSYNWQLTQTSNLITGSLSMDVCGTMSVAGSFLGNGAFSVRATPQTNLSCVPIDYSGSVNKPGCQTTSGVWQQGNQSWAWSKSCDIPIGESSSAFGWTAEGTTMNWVVTLSPGSINFGGRTISENTSTVDNCWFTGSDIPYQTGESGNPADINIYNQYSDIIGWTPPAVSYYRSVDQAPCGFTSTQRMFIDCSDGSASYIVNALSGVIGVTTVSSSRQGQTASRNWP